MTCTDVLTESWVYRFKRLYVANRLQFPIEMAFKGDGWEVGGVTDGRKYVRMFSFGTPKEGETVTFPVKMHGTDANGKHFEMELI